MAIRQKKYNWKETNLSVFGSDLEKKVQYECALTERILNASHFLRSRRQMPTVRMPGKKQEQRSDYKSGELFSLR